MNQMSQFLVSHGEPLLFLAIFAEQVGVPLPAAPLLVATGALAAEGAFHPSSAIGVTMLACVLADLIWFYLGRRGGERLLHFLCARVLSNPTYFERTQRLFKRYGMPAVAASKFVPGLSLLFPPLSGAFGVGVARFVCFDALGSLLYGTFYLTLGVLFANEVNVMLEILSNLGTKTAVLGVGLVTIFLGYKYVQRRKVGKPVAALTSRPMAAVPGTS
jgi:membrane protein DedA with SNARE-associated domain